MESPARNPSPFSTFIQLESAARDAETVEALRTSMVNEPRRLLPYRQAALVIFDDAGGVMVEAISGVAVLEADAPMVSWLTRAARQIRTGELAARLHVVQPEALAPAEREDWTAWIPPAVLWCPLKSPDGTLIGALWLAREEQWQESEAVMLQQLAGCYVHAWLALVGRRRALISAGARKPMLIGVPLAILLAMVIPVRQTVLAPAEIVAAKPETVSAPIDGVIARFQVQPNQPVSAGQVLFTFDDTTLRAQATAAERTLGVALAELRQSTQGAMVDRKQAGQVALNEAQVRLRQTELDYARDQLSRMTVTAKHGGVAVFTDENDWIGRPVVTGQRILQIADPAHVELNIEVPVREAIVLTAGSPIDLFLDVEPLSSKPAILTGAGYEAEMTPAGMLSYRVRAVFSAQLPPPRIGLQGTAKIYGDRVPLGLYLFRRPLASVRQWLGM
ncbi:MAG: HlyD family efflux transporter periplasmic adaptor subunit [Rhodospirillaceae bacterium]